MQEIFAIRPLSVIEKSESNTKVKQPFVEVIIPGGMLPENVPIKGELELGPS